MPEHTIKAIVFDMGGVFVQTKDKNPRTQLAQRLGLSFEELSEVVFQSETARQATVGALEESAHWAFLASHFSLNQEQLPVFWDEFWGGDLLDQDLYGFAKDLKKTYKLGLLSNAWSGARNLLTRKFGFLDIFDVSVFSAEVKMAKPDPSFYQWMLEALLVNSGETIFVDDFIENIMAARELGFKAVHFINTNQAIKEINAILGS